MNEETDKILELGDDFDFDDFQVVRREFFAHTTEPAVSFNNCKFYVNSACLSKFPGTDYVQVLINRQSRVMALRPCQEGDRDSFAWCGISKGKRRPKQPTCKFFFAQMVSMMGWDPEYRYKILGRRAHAKKAKTSRIPVFPENWKGQFGLPFREHRQSMQINIFDGYAVYAIKNSQPSEADANSQTGQGDNSHGE